MRTRTLRLTAAVSVSALVLAAMLSCSTSSDSPADPGGFPGPGGGGPVELTPPVISSLTPTESCATAGNLITIEGTDLVDNDFLATVTINGVAATVSDRFDGGAAGTDTLVVTTPAIAVPNSGLLADVRVTTERGSDSVTGGLRLFPGCDGPPILVSITPGTGVRAGFEPVELVGDNLACLTGVQFVSTTGTTVLSADILSVASDQSIMILTPPNIDPSAAPYQVVATSACGTNAAPRPTFQYTGSVSGGGPTIPDATSILDVLTSLPQGPAVGGNQVRIAGRDLNLVTRVNIGAVELVTGEFVLTANGDIIIPAMPPSPLGASSTVGIAVTVESADGVDSTPVTYTYIGVGQPNCAGITPNSGPLGGGTSVTISGQNLNDVDQVTFGGVAATQVFYPTADGSQIVVKSPAFPVPIDVDIALQVSNGSTFSTIDTCTPVRFTYVDVNTQPPFSVTDIVPDQGPQTGGSTIVVTGTGLDLVTSVTICGVPANITSAVSEQVQATTGLFDGTVPTTCDIVVTTSTGLSATLDDAFTYLPVVPDAQAFAPDSTRTAPAAGGTFFRLQGINLIGVTGVNFGGTQVGAAEACELDVQSNTQVSGTVPAYLTPGAAFPASVTVVAESAAGVDSFPPPLTFTYYANPTVSDARGPLNDDRIQANERVVLTGTNFRPVNDVFVGQIEISNSGVTGNGAAGSDSVVLDAGEFTVVSNGRIEFDFPSSLLTEDFYDVTIRTPRQGASCVSDYEDTAARTLFLGARPTTGRVQPSVGRWDGGTTVTISGSFTVPVTRVSICGVDYVPTAQTTTSVTVVTRSTGTEAAAGTPCDVIVFNAAGASDPIAGAFTFLRSPDLASVEVTTQNCGLRSSTTGTVPVTEGQVLTLRGSDFGLSTLAGVNKVLIGSAEATILSSNRSDTRIDVSVPAAPAGTRFAVTAQVVFTADTPFSSTLPLVVDYQDLPTISAVNPSTASAGATITVTGTNLRNVDGTPTVVTIGGQLATVLTATDTSLSVLVPAPVAGTLGTPLALTVTTCQGQTSSTFTYPCPLPRITSFTPATGAPPGQVTITGTDLLVGTNVTTVTFGTTSANVDLANSGPTSLRVDIPAGSAGAQANITVTTCGGAATTATPFTYTCAAPAITNVTPGFGLPGTAVTITGSFENAGAAPVVRFGGTQAQPLTSFSTTQIVVPAPVGTGTVDVSVQTCGGTATQLGGFTYCTAPNATSVVPGTGAPGAIVVVGGTNLQDPNGTPPTVSFTVGTTTVSATVVASSPTSVQVQVPSGLTGVATVNVTTCGGTDAAGTFQYCVTPTITTISPTTGAAGTQVTITGTNLIGANNVDAVIRFGGVVASNVLFASSTQFIVQAPAGPTGQVVVDATTCGGTGQATTLFSYCAQPVVNSILPTNGAAGDEVTIFGSNLIGANGVRGAVTFGQTAATVIDALADGSQMTVVAPGGFTQGQTVNVRVTTCGGASATSPTTVFTYQTSTTCVAPTITGISPSAAAAGQQLTVTGTNLIGNDGSNGIVRVGGVTATLIAATPTQLVVTVPPGAGTVGVSVQTCGGTAQSSSLFTYCTTPVLTSVTPGSGTAGSTVILAGTNLLGANGANPVVTFGTAQATIVDQTATQLTVVAPAGIASGTTVSVRVTTCGGASGAQPFQYVSTTQFDVTSVTPSAGPNTGGQVISISGTGLNGTGASDILGIQICDVNVQSFVQVSDTLVQATTAAFNGAVPATCDVEVILVDGRQDTLVSGYTYLPPVPDGRVFDDSGSFTINAPQAGGTTFRILGVNLIGVDSVNFGGFTGVPEACNIQVASDTQVTGIVPAYATPLGTTQNVEVFVQSAAGVDPTTVEVAPSGSGVLFRYHPNPSPTSVSYPPMPNLAGNRTVTVTGTNFIVGSDVFLDGAVTIKNLGLTDPDNFPADTVFDFTVPITSVTDGGGTDTFTFDFPDFSTGDFYAVTFTTPNQGASCVDAYSASVLVFVASEAFCANLGDDDQDTLVDCLDPDCEAEPACP